MPAVPQEGSDAFFYMTTGRHTIEDVRSPGWTSWLWVLLCAAGIYALVPVARVLQRFVYDIFGKEFFTYAVLFVIGTASSGIRPAFFLCVQGPQSQYS